MCSMNSLRPEASLVAINSETGTVEAVRACPFCGSLQTADMEVDIGRWAVWCSWCNALGPHSQSRQLAVARWNSPIERGVLDPSPNERP